MKSSKKWGTVSRNKIYKLDKEGRLIDIYNSKKEFIKFNKMCENEFYRLLRGKVLKNDSYYISTAINIEHLKLAKKSLIQSEKTVENYNILSNYRDQLILNQGEYYNSRAATKIKNEIINITKILTSW